MKVHAGDPLDQSALLETQRKLYNLALFNEVNAAVQNPDGDAPRKNVLLQLTEAKRWDVTYGFGFEAQTGTPPKGVINPASAILLGIRRRGVFAEWQDGRESAGVAGCEPDQPARDGQVADAAHDVWIAGRGGDADVSESALLRQARTLRSSVSGGYSNVQNIYDVPGVDAAGRLSGDAEGEAGGHVHLQLRVPAGGGESGDLQVSANLIPQLSQPVRVGGPGITWFHDTRDPSPLDATQGHRTRRCRSFWRRRSSGRRRTSTGRT